LEGFSSDAQIHANTLTMKIVFLFLSILLFVSCSLAQGYSTKSKKAIRLYEEGLEMPRQLDQRTGHPNYRGAIAKMEAAIEKDPSFWEAHLMAGEFYEMFREYTSAIQHFQDAIRINPNHSASGSTYYFLSNLLAKEGRYDEAIKTIDQFMLFRSANPQLKQDANKLKGDCLFAMEAKRHPVNYNPINVGPGINTENPEYFPTITVDGKTLLFTRRIKDSRVRGPIPEQEDFYVSNLENNHWSTGVPMPRNVNTINNEGAPTMGPDGRSLIFVACPDASGENYGENRTGFGSCDLFYTKRIGNNWTNPVNVPGGVNTRNWETQPSLSADGKTLYFIRGVYGRGGQKSSDIYKSTLGIDGTWGLAEKLSDIINTPYEEESVLIHPDGKTLYFASRGHQGMGGTDLFMSRADDKGNWTRPVNLGYPINTSYDENSLLVDASGEVAFFASDRDGGFGGLDIYYFEMPKHLRPLKTLYFEGLVYDAQTKKPIPGKFQLIDLETGKEVIYAEADAVSGEFMVTLPINKRYALNVSYPNYAFYSSNFDMKNNKGLETIRMDVPMVPIKSSMPTVLNNVFFDLGKATLRAESYVELNKLVDFLRTNNKLKIEIGGHTDTRGDKTNNQLLSENRAKSVHEYLISKGIEVIRLTYKGYGQTQNVISDATIAKLIDADAIEKAHQKNRRTEYKIIP
jgi:outer membrane protein OmpA-like peptidoglycan-associated protein